MQGLRCLHFIGIYLAFNGSSYQANVPEKRIEHYINLPDVCTISLTSNCPYLIKLSNQRLRKF